MRELRVEDALLYLDQVKVEFGDRPHIYNEFLEIMKTFKTQQIDTPGVIQRVSNLFKGNRKLVLGFNTFLPEGYQIELSNDNGPPIAVYRAPGSNVAQILRDTSEPPPPMGALPKTAPPPHASLPPHAQPPPMQPSTHGHPPPPPPPVRHPVHMPPQPPPHVARLHTPAAPSTEPSFGQKPMPPPIQAHAPPPQNQVAALSREHPPMRAGKHPLDPQRPAPPGAQQPRRGAAPQPATARETKLPPSNGPLRPAPVPHGPQGNSHVRPRPAGGGPGQMGYAASATEKQSTQPQPVAPLEFDHAINYVTTIKKRFASEPEIYKKFLEILHTYQKEQRGIKDVLEEVSELFADHPDLLKEFTYFLPDGVQAQAKIQLEQAAKEAEARKRAQAKEAIMSTAQTMQKQAQAAVKSRQPELDRTTVIVPFGALQGRTEEQEHVIARNAQYGVVSFKPVRPPKKNEPTPLQAAIKFGRPVAIPPLPRHANNSESLFFQRVKDHLERRELQSERPAGYRRHTPWVEFLKCLHLFGAGIVNRDELLLLVKSLLIHGHAPKTAATSGGGTHPAVVDDANELLRAFEELMVGRGPCANQVASHKDKSKYGAIRMRDFDFSHCDNPTPSYFALPADYPKNLLMAHSGQSNVDGSVTKCNFVCVGASENKAMSIEDYDGVRERRNMYEEMMFRIEDERFELDMAIERNANTLRRIEAFAEEAEILREREEKDGQPIGRLQYKLNKYALNSININAIARVYGERGDEVLQHLSRNPLVVLPIIYRRLKQKDAEWRRCKAELTPKLNALCAANYEGSLDVLCYFNRRELERLSSSSRLRDECIRAEFYCKHPPRLKGRHISKLLLPNFSTRHEDPKAFLCRPHLSVSCAPNISHKFALDLITAHVNADPTVSAMIRERIGRIVSEFLTPLFGYPAHWILDEVRKSYRGTMSPNIVKYAAGQRVLTVFGEGTVAGFINSTETSTAHYRVKLPFGIGFLAPWAILSGIPTREATYVRSDGSMVRVESLLGPSNGSTQLEEKYQVMFCTEGIYLFIRLFSLLCSVLNDTREHCLSCPPPKDPSLSYSNSFEKDNEKRDTLLTRLDLSTILAALKKVIINQLDAKEFEALSRKVCKAKVHQMAAMPKLITRCASALITTAKEDVLLSLYDYCRHRKVDPATVRAHCFSVAADATYRIQYDRASGELCFCYLPKSESLSLGSPQEPKSQVDEDVTSADNGNATSMMEASDDEEGLLECDTSDSTGHPIHKKPRLR